MSEKPPTADKYDCKLTGWAQCPECGSEMVQMHIGDEAVGYSGNAQRMNWFECLDCGADSWPDD